MYVDKSENRNRNMCILYIKRNEICSFLELEFSENLGYCFSSFNN